MFQMINPSHQFCIQRVGNSYNKKFISFFTAKDYDKIGLAIQAKFNDFSKYPTLIYIYDIKSKSNHKYQGFFDSKILSEIRDELMTYLVAEKLIIDIKNTRLRVVVRNKLSSSNDVKGLTFNTDKSLNEVYNELKSFYDIYNRSDNKVIFGNDNDDNKTSHYVILSYAGSMARMKNGSRCLSIKLKNYSSEEVINLLKGANNER